MTAVSPWAISASNTFMDSGLSFLYEKRIGQFNFKVHLTEDSLWILADNEPGGRIAFRAAYTPGGDLELSRIVDQGGEVIIDLDSSIGKISVKVKIAVYPEAGLNYKTVLRTKKDLFIPFWPRDIVITGKGENPENTAGKVHVSQEGTRSGLLYFSLTRPKAGSVMYMQNLTALADYNQQTETSGGGVVGGQWPELGFSLPPAIEKPLKANREVIISDALVIFSEQVPEDEPSLIRQYLDLMSKLYLQLPLPATEYNDWPEILKKGLKDLIENPGCWSRVGGHRYLTPYVSDYESPPEIMVQLAVLLPLVDYSEWHGEEVDIMSSIRDGLPAFYDKKLGVIKRWLPAAEDKLTGEEEQKQPDVMDSWYLHHPMLNLSRLALKGDKAAETLFLDSLDYTIKVARHFKYQWPVFYHMETLEIIKAETKPGEGGEKDVPGIYAHVMLQAYELTGSKKYLKEAEKAARTLSGLGFKLFYQANNTSFSAGALMRLYKITKEEVFLDLSYLCIANVMKNVQLWDCNYGYGKNFPTFFALFPLSDAPYTAVYEEQEVFCALHDYLKLAEGVKILPAVSLLLAEYIRNLIHRAVYYYPPLLPKEMLSEEVKTGEVDPNLWIALEDLHDGWEKSGEVGQEVYGAGNAFGILPRHYIKIPGKEFMIFTDYPRSGTSIKKNEVRFTVLGDERLTSKIRVVSPENKKIPKFIIKGERQGEIVPKADKSGAVEYTVYGDQELRISWK